MNLPNGEEAARSLAAAFFNVDMVFRKLKL